MAKRYVIEKSKELPRAQKFHGLTHDSEYKTVATVEGVGIPMGVVPMTEEEVQIVRELPQVVRVYEDETISYPPIPPVSRDVEAAGVQALNLHRSPELWAKGIKGRDVDVWVLDTGIDQTHAYGVLQGTLKGVSSVSNIGGPGWDYDGHGTWCAGMVGEPNGEYGVAPECNLYSCKVLGDDGSGTWSGIVEGIDRSAAAGADVISLSLGGSGNADSPVVRAVDAAADKGIVVVVASGNDGCAGDPADSSVPARSTKVVTVAAHDLNKQMASFSSCGSCVDVAGMGVGATSLGLNGVKGAKLSGTSMATPHVAGLAVLLRGAGFTGVEVQRALKNGAVDLGFAASQQGAGMADVVRAYDLLARTGGGDGLPRMSYANLARTPKNDLPDKVVLTYYKKDHALLDRI